MNPVSGTPLASLGLVFDTAAGAISGTPGAAGTSVFTVTVTDSAAATATSAQVTLTISAQSVQGALPNWPGGGTALALALALVSSSAGNGCYFAATQFAAPASLRRPDHGQRQHHQLLRHQRRPG